MPETRVWGDIVMAIPATELDQLYRGAARGLDPLTRAFEGANALPDADALQRSEWRRNLVLRAQTGDAKAAILLGPVSFVGGDGLSAEARERKEREDAQWHNLVAEQTRQLHERLQALYEQIREIDREIENFTRRARELHEQIEAIDRVSAKFLKNGEIDRDENGNLKDRRAEEALREYERRTGQKVDRGNFSEIWRALQDQKLHAVVPELHSIEGPDGELERLNKKRKVLVEETQANKEALISRNELTKREESQIYQIQKNYDGGITSELKNKIEKKEAQPIADEKKGILKTDFERSATLNKDIDNIIGGFDLRDNPKKESLKPLLPSS